MKSSHFYYIILFSFLLAACKDDGPGEKENSDNDVPSVATNTWLLNSLDNRKLFQLGSRKPIRYKYGS